MTSLPTLLFLSLSLLVPRAALAQAPARSDMRAEVFVGSEMENYLRYLQTVGSVPLYPWSVRGFSPAEVDRLVPQDSTHPWARRYHPAAYTGGLQARLIRPRLDVYYNSGFPHGRNDGALWVGRGMTTAIRLGFAGRYGPLSLVVAPVAFWSENREFALTPNGHEGDLRYGAWRDAHSIDLPQRFGDEPYAKVDPGPSSLRLDVAGIAAGVSTANQHWGPASDHAVLLGNNAPGFAHVFLGTARPVDLWIGRIHGRLVWGRLEQSEFSPADAERATRFGSGMVAAFSPRGLDGLEVGLGRFFHDHWPEDGLRADLVLRPFEVFLKEDLDEHPDVASGNQVVSAFARWVAPGAGFEIYGEYGREDHSWNLRHLLLEPDDIGAYLLGFRKAWSRPEGRLVAIRGEVFNSEISHLTLTDRVRAQSAMYRHSRQVQGHTHQGQLLASAAGFGGGASVLVADLYHPDGRWSIAWERTLRGYRGDYRSDGKLDPRGLDVAHTIGIEALRFRGRLDLVGEVSGTYNFNRNFAEDAFNLRVKMSAAMAF